MWISNRTRELPIPRRGANLLFGQISPKTEENWTGGTCPKFYYVHPSLAITRSTSVTPEVNLKNPLHTGNEGIHPGCETQGKCHRSPKQEYQWPHKKG